MIKDSNIKKLFAAILLALCTYLLVTFLTTKEQAAETTPSVYSDLTNKVSHSNPELKQQPRQTKPNTSDTAIETQAETSIDQPKTAVKEIINEKDIIRKSLIGEVNLAQELYIFRDTYCENIPDLACNLLIKAYLQKNFEDQSEQLYNIYQQYIEYENYISYLDLPARGSKDYLLATQTLRIDFFDAEAHAILFSTDNARLNYLLARDAFFTFDAISIPSSQRPEKLEQLKVEHFGEHYPFIVQRFKLIDQATERGLLSKLQ